MIFAFNFCHLPSISQLCVLFDVFETHRVSFVLSKYYTQDCMAILLECDWPTMDHTLKEHWLLLPEVIKDL